MRGREPLRHPYPSAMESRKPQEGRAGACPGRLPGCGHLCGCLMRVHARVCISVHTCACCRGTEDAQVTPWGPGLPHEGTEAVSLGTGQGWDGWPGLLPAPPLTSPSHPLPPSDPRTRGPVLLQVLGPVRPRCHLRELSGAEQLSSRCTEARGGLRRKEEGPKAGVPSGISPGTDPQGDKVPSGPEPPPRRSPRPVSPTQGGRAAGPRGGATAQAQEAAHGSVQSPMNQPGPGPQVLPWGCVGGAGGAAPGHEQAGVCGPGPSGVIL